VQPKWGYLAAGVGLFAILALLALAASRGTALAGGMFAALVIAWCVLAGIAGTLALCMWLFTKHTFMYQNETILMLNPLLIVFAGFVPAAVRRGEGGSIFRALLFCVTALTAVAALLFVLPGMGQDNFEMIAVAVPANLALFAGFRLLSGGSRRDGRGRFRA
jgi:hypothetical protein